MYNSSFSFSRVIRWFLRFRKRCGYGIHSPFAFNIVTGVIYEKGHYYAYDELLKQPDSSSNLRLKDNRLLFKLVNNTNPSQGLIVGDKLGITLDYIVAVKRTCNWHQLRCNEIFKLHSLFEQHSCVDFVYIDDASILTDVYDIALPYVGEHTLLVVRGIYDSQSSTDAWRRIQSDTKVRVTFDLYDFGLVYFESKLSKENYIINYF